MTRGEALEILDTIPTIGNQVDALEMAIKALEQEPTTWSLDDAREDFMYDVYNTLDFLPTNNEANRIIDSFDRVTSGLNQQACEDCISRQDVLDIDFERIMLTTAKPIEMIEQKVKALPPVIPKGVTVTDFADKCRECGREKVLDKIRAEIIENSIEDYKYHGCGSDELIIETSEVLKIIDKYKAEREVKYGRLDGRGTGED